MKKAYIVIAILVLVCIVSFGLLVWSLTSSVLITILKGGKVVRVGLTGGISYSIDGSNWTAVGVGVPNSAIVDPLYARIEITADGYAGPITVTWKLIDDSSGIEVKVLTDYTSTTLTGSSGQIVYATTDGLNAPGYNFGPYCSTPGTVYVQAEVYKP